MNEIARDPLADGYETPIRLCRVDKFDAKSNPVNFVIDRILLERSLAGLVGPPGAMKTLLLADWAACIATGEKWLGHKVRRGPTFLLLGESNIRVFRRFHALKKLRGIELDRAPIYVSNRLDSFGSLERVRAASDLIQRRCQKIGKPPAFIGIDPLSKAMLSGDENSAGDMNSVLDNIQEWFVNRFGCTVVVAHHTGHAGQRARGSSAFKAGLDTEMVIARAGMKVTLKCTKQKDEDEFAPIHLLAQTVKFEKGDAVEGSSVAFVSAETKNPLGKRESALELLTRLQGAKRASILTTLWRDRTLEEGILPSPKSFEKMKARLSAAGAIRVVGREVQAVGR